MRVGIVILCIFAAVWAIAGITVEQMPTALVVVPLAVSAAILLWARRQPLTGEQGPHVGRLVGIWSGVEGIAMFVTANILINSHHRDALMPAFAIIVGAHFVPLARGIPVRIYYLTGGVLIAVGLAGLLLGLPHVPLFVGLASAAILWASATALAKGAA